MHLLNIKSTMQSNIVAFFIADLHLHAALPHTTQAFYNFLIYQAIQAQHLYLLGDIFEYWAGDDDITSPYNYNIVNALRNLSKQNVKIFWLSGNRDFLIGKDFAVAANVTILQEPYIIKIANRVIALVHGDAQCTDDFLYMTFRAKVRQLKWKKKFLTMSLSQRKTIIKNFRKDNCNYDKKKYSKSIDINFNALSNLYISTNAHILIHGHTHQPALHTYIQNGLIRLRYVLPNWEYDAKQIRGGWISLTTDGNLHYFDSSGQHIDLNKYIIAKPAFKKV